jgi:hypothetical protein
LIRTLSPLRIFPPPEERQRGRPTERDGGGILEGKVGRFRYDRRVFSHNLVLSVTAHASTAGGKDLITHPEPGHVFTGSLDLSGEFGPQDGLSWPEDTKNQARNKPEASRHIEASYPAVAGRYGRRAHLDQDFVDLRHRFVHFFEPKYARRSVTRVHDRFHKRLTEPFLPTPQWFTPL